MQVTNPNSAEQIAWNSTVAQTQRIATLALSHNAANVGVSLDDSFLWAVAKEKEHTAIAKEAEAAALAEQSSCAQRLIDSLAAKTETANLSGAVGELPAGEAGSVTLTAQAQAVETARLRNADNVNLKDLQASQPRRRGLATRLANSDINATPYPFTAEQIHSVVAHLFDKNGRGPVRQASINRIPFFKVSVSGFEKTANTPHATRHLAIIVEDVDWAFAHAVKQDPKFLDSWVFDEHDERISHDVIAFHIGARILGLKNHPRKFDLNEPGELIGCHGRDMDEFLGMAPIVDSARSLCSIQFVLDTTSADSDRSPSDMIVNAEAFPYRNRDFDKMHTIPKLADL